MLVHRPWELLAHLCVLAALGLQYGDIVDEKVLLGVNVAWIVLYLLSSQTEGLRLQQIICGIAYVPFSLYFFIAIGFGFWESTSVLNMVIDVLLTLLAAFGWTHNVYYTAVLGLADFSRTPINGPFKVGVRWIRTSQHDSETLVFYPIDQSEHDKHIKRRNAPWLHKPV